MTKSWGHALGVSVSLTCLMAASALWAQSSPNNAEGKSSSAAIASTGLAEVVVTAQRRNENLQRVPIAVTALSSSDLINKQIVSTMNLGEAVPNMYSSNNVGQGSANTYYIRALGQGNSFPTFEPQVGTYIDDIYIARSNASNFALFGVDQIQVLSGPQGTLFGRNSTGGAIVVTLQRPAATFGGTAQLGYGSFDQFSGQFSVDMPFSDQIRTRTSIFGITNNGYVEDLTTHQTLNYTHNVGIREALLFLPAGLSNVEWYMSADYVRADNANVLNMPSDSGGVNGSDRIAYSGFSTTPGALAPYLTGLKGTLGQGALVTTYGFMSNLKMSFDAGTLNLITGFRGLQQDLAVDYADSGLGALIPYDESPVGTFALAEELRSYQYSQEIKWTGKVGDWLSYTAGAFYMYETNPHNYGAVANVAGVLGVPGLTYFPAVIGDEDTNNKSNSSAVYAQADFKATSQLTFTLGGRYTHEVKSLTASPNAVGEGFTTAQVQAEGYLTHLVADEFTPRFAIQYQVDPNVMVFASATRGFQGGGWNGLAFTANTYNNFGPETVWSYETGFRSEVPDQHLRLNATAFYENVSNFQQQGYDQTASSFTTNNVASLEAYGLEANVTWRPVEHLNLNANLGLIKAAFFNPSAAIRTQQTQCVTLGQNCDTGIVTPTGSLGAPAYTPPVTTSGTISYDFVLDKVTVTPTATVSYTGNEWIDTANTPGVGRTAAHTLLNLGLTFAPRNSPLTITAECSNCTMVDYWQFYLFNFHYYNYPGTWDVRINYKF